MGSLPQTEFVDLELAEGWLTIWLNRPEARNALTPEMIGELNTALRVVSDDREVRGITLRGRGGVFCAGGDLKGFRDVFQGATQDIAEVAAANRKAGELFCLLDGMPQVVIMLVEGAAMAGGLGMVCTGDVVAVTEDAKFAITETTLGIPPAQIAPFVVRRLGLKTARRLMLTAARFNGLEAMQLGLADHVAADAAALNDIEAEVKKNVMACAPGASAVTKELLHAVAHLERDAMLDMAAARFASCMQSDEGREGIAAFFEKRKPSWVPSR
jgi:isohexenylglutaconyl-CoA hydratase